MVTIYGMNAHGEGLFDHNGKQKQVAYVLPGEVVEVSSDRKERNFYLDHIVKESASRIAPICPHFSLCGGCTLQHANASLYEEIKMQGLREAFRDICAISPLIQLKSGERRRANLEAVKKEDKIFLGFHRLKSHQIINIDHCPALTPSLRSLLKPFAEALQHILEHKQKAQIFLLESDTGIDLALEICFVQNLTEVQRHILEEFARTHHVQRLFFRYRKIRDVIYQQGPVGMIFEGHTVPIDAYGFAQATKEADITLSRLVTEALPPHVTRIADLFAGRGTLSFSLAKHAPVDAFESEPKAIADVTSIHPPFSVHTRDLFENPLTTEELRLYDVVVLDPPRAGAFTQTEYLRDSQVQTIIYVSCNPVSLKRDVDILLSTYTLEKIIPVDQFAWTAHLEVVAILRKNPTFQVLSPIFSIVNS